MRKSENLYNDREIRAFLEEGSEFEGKLNFTGVVRLNGKFVGDIDSEDTLILGETAYVEGNIRVGIAIIGGRLVGDVATKHCLEILGTGIVEGTITSTKLITHEGAQIHGQISVQHEKPEITLSQVEINSTRQLTL
jgi:cytoskeletal protein CcmA (bactofilin family)